MHPSSHDLPWLSKPLVLPDLLLHLTNTYTIPRASIPPSHRLCVTLMLPHHSSVMLIPPLNTFVTFSQSLCNTHVTSMTNAAGQWGKSSRTRNLELRLFLDSAKCLSHHVFFFFFFDRALPQFISKSYREFTSNIGCPHGLAPCSHDLPAKGTQGPKTLWHPYLCCPKLRYLYMD